MPSPSPISALTVQPARSTVGAALRPLPGFGVNRDFFFLVVSQYPVSIDSYPIKHRGHAGLSLGLMSPLFDGEPQKMPKTGNQSAAAKYLGISRPTFINYRNLGFFRNALIAESIGKPRRHTKSGKLTKPRVSALYNLELLFQPHVPKVEKQ